MPTEPKMQDVLNAVQALATHMDERFGTKDDLKCFATKDDLKQLATKEDLRQVEDKMTQMETRVTNHIDGFLVLHQTHDVEMVAVRSRCDRMEDFMEDVADRLNMDFERT